MMRLAELRGRVGLPITKILHEAVVVYFRVLTAHSEAQIRCCDHPQLQWKGTLENATIECPCGFVLADDGQLVDWLDPEQIAAQQEQAEQ